MDNNIEKLILNDNKEKVFIEDLDNKNNNNDENLVFDNPISISLNDYIKFDMVCKEYINGEINIVALSNVSFSIKKGEFVVILGDSGAGKSTALNLLGGMDKPTSGKIYVDKKEISKYNEDELAEYRRKDVGFVFQFYNLIQNLNAKENVEISTEIADNPIEPLTILDKVGLTNRANNFPSQLSGGEQQRVSIARAIAKKPKLLLCDEPTGALDYKIGKQILKLLQEISKSQNITTIIITHNSAISAMADKIITFRSGMITNIEINNNVKNVDEIEW